MRRAVRDLRWNTLVVVISTACGKPVRSEGLHSVRDALTTKILVELSKRLSVRIRNNKHELEGEAHE